MFTDLFVHRTTRMIATMGVRYPARVVGAGGIYLEYDDRDVPDVATIVADYDEGCQLIISGDDDQRLRPRPGHPRPPRHGEHDQPATTKASDRVRCEDHAAEPAAAARAQFAAARRESRWVGGGISEGDGTAAAVGELPAMRPRSQPRDAEHAGTGGGRLHDGGDGRAELPHRPGAVLGQGASPRRAGRQQLGAALGGAQPRATAGPARSSAGTAARAAARCSRRNTSGSPARG